MVCLPLGPRDPSANATARSKSFGRAAVFDGLPAPCNARPRLSLKARKEPWRAHDQASASGRPPHGRCHRGLLQPATTPPRTPDPQVPTMLSGADAKQLIGHNVKNPQEETVGEIESVYINADGKVD